MKKFIALFLTAIFAMSLMCACSDQNGADEDVVKIGFVGPLTGESAPWGEAQCNTIQMLIDEINESGGILGGRKIKLYSYDNRADNIETANIAKRLIQQDGVCAIIGPNASGAAIAMASICDENKVPMIATNATSVNVTIDDDGNVRPYVFRITLTDPQLGGIIAEYAYKNAGIKNVAVLYELGSDYSIGITNTFMETFESCGGTIVAEEAFKTNDTDFRAQLSKIKGTEPDAIFFPAYYKQIALCARQAKELDVDSIFLGTDTWLVNDVLNTAGSDIEGAIFTGSMDTADPGLDSLKERYLARFGEEIDAAGVTGYFGNDALSVLLDAIERAGCDDPIKICEALNTVKDVEICYGTLTMNSEDHNPIRAASIVEVQDVQFVTIDSFVPGA